MLEADVLQDLLPTFVLGLDEADVAHLARVVEVRRHAAGTPLIVADEPHGDLLVVRSGRLAVSAPPNVPIGDKGAREWTGELGFVEPGPAPLDVTASRDSELLAIGHDALVALRDEPHVVGRLLIALARDLAARIRACASVAATGHPDRGAALRHALATLHGMPHVPEPGAWMPSGRPPGADPDVSVEEARGRLWSRLRDESSFGPLDDNLLNLLVRAAYFETFEDGETVIRRAEDRDGLFLILEGAVRVTSASPLVEYGPDRRLGAGELFGQLAFVDGGLRSATCTAAAPTTLAVWYPEMIEELLRVGAGGGLAAVHFLHWLLRQLGRDARRLGGLLLNALPRS